jgi:hypothetical protein
VELSASTVVGIEISQMREIVSATGLLSHIAAIAEKL